MVNVVQTGIERKEANMPGGDGTGPVGAGAMTGRQAGYCVSNNQPRYINQGFGRGPQRGLGRGFGSNRSFDTRKMTGYRGNNRFIEDTPDVSEKIVLENAINTIKEQLSSLEKRLSTFEKES